MVREVAGGGAPMPGAFRSGADETAPADVTILKHGAPTDEAVAKEAKKGYGS